MKLDMEMLKQLALIIIGVLAALAGYNVVTGDDSVTIAVPAAEEAPAAEPASEEAEAAEEAASEE